MGARVVSLVVLGVGVGREGVDLESGGEGKGETYLTRNQGSQS